MQHELEQPMDAGRRRFLWQSLVGTGMVVAGPLSGWHRLAQAVQAPSTLILEHLGPLGEPDALGVRLPAGLRARVVARSGQPVLNGGGYRWHL
ncbi:MAG TPA: hypothetical protein VFK46_07095, partial [Candidatus Macondimonas sp.]|nr:hypothetical protein [Candidatus Macondimonas sp.]